MRKEAEEMLGRSGASRPGVTPPGSASEDRRAAAEMTLLTIVGDSARVEGKFDIAESIHWAATMPLHVNVNTIELMATAQSFGPFQVARDA